MKCLSWGGKKSIRDSWKENIVDNQMQCGTPEQQEHVALWAIMSRNKRQISLMQVVLETFKMEVAKFYGLENDH